MVGQMQAIFLIIKRYNSIIKLILNISTCRSNADQASKKYPPHDLYAGVSNNNRLLNEVVTAKGISNESLVISREEAAKPVACI